MKLPLGDANDSDGCHHRHRRAPPQTHTPARTLATSCGCVHVLTSCSVYLPAVMSQLHSLLSLAVSPFLSPCNFTLSTLVSCLFANTDCSRPGLDFPVLTSPLLYLYLSVYLNTHSPSSHSLLCVCPPPYSPYFCVISKNMCVFRKHTSLMFLRLLSLLKSQTVFPLSNLRLIPLPTAAASSVSHGGKISIVIFGSQNLIFCTC